jgi:hypothetical protein
MYTRKYGSVFLKPDDVRDGPRQERILAVFESQMFDRLVLELESGNQFSLNVGNTRNLQKAYGPESDNWCGQTIELSLGHYKDWRTDPPEEKETVTLRPVSVRQPSPDNGGSKATSPMVRPPVRDNLDDEIPFVLAFVIASAVTWLAAGASTLIA